MGRLVDDVRARYHPGFFYVLWPGVSDLTRSESFAARVAFRWETAAEEMLALVLRLRSGKRSEPESVEADAGEETEAEDGERPVPKSVRRIGATHAASPEDGAPTEGIAEEGPFSRRPAAPAPYRSGSLRKAPGGPLGEPSEGELKAAEESAPEPPSAQPWRAAGRAASREAPRGPSGPGEPGGVWRAFRGGSPEESARSGRAFVSEPSELARGGSGREAFGGEGGRKPRGPSRSSPEAGFRAPWRPSGEETTGGAARRDAFRGRAPPPRGALEPTEDILSAEEVWDALRGYLEAQRRFAEALDEWHRTGF